MPAVFDGPDLPCPGHPRLRLCSRRLVRDVVRRVRGKGRCLRLHCGRRRYLPVLHVERHRHHGGLDARKRQQHGHGQCDTGDVAAQSRHRAIAGGVEHGQHAAFELSGPRHAHDERRRPIRAQRIGELEQVAGVLAGLLAGAQHAVVARQLSLDPQASGHPPGARMHPVQRAHDGRQHLREAIAPRDVRQLVQDHGPAPVECPRVGDRGNQDGMPAGANSHRHRLFAAPQQAHGDGDAQTARAFVQQPQPVAHRRPRLRSRTRRRAATC